MRNTLRRFLDDERGSAVLEYSVLIGGIALAIIAVIQAFGVELGSLFHGIAAGIQSLNNSK
jgi:Flp pilus assembly pilin Flp